jgi:hypothetical protein
MKQENYQQRPYTKEPTKAEKHYSSTSSITDNFQENIDMSFANLGLNGTANTQTFNSIDEHLIAREETRIWIAAQHYINGYKRLKALSCFPELTKQEIQDYVSDNLLLSDAFEILPKKSPGHIFGKFLLAYMNGIKCSIGSNNTEIAENYQNTNRN